MGDQKYKSIGEEAIAEILTKNNIEFIYEYPLLINEQKENDTPKLRIWYPDFWLPRYSIVIEYFGVEGDKNYNDGIQSKKSAYNKLHIDYIPVYPSTIKKDLTSYLLKSIAQRINDNIRHFRNRTKQHTGLDIK